MISSFMRRSLTAIVLTAGATLLQGCVYNPYTGGYDTCCAYPAYGYGYTTYGYPAYSYGYGGGVVVGGAGSSHGRTWDGGWDTSNHQ